MLLYAIMKSVGVFRVASLLSLFLLFGCQSNIQTAEQAAVALGVESQQWQAASDQTKKDWQATHAMYTRWLSTSSSSVKQPPMRVYVHNGMVRNQGDKKSLTPIFLHIKHGTCAKAPIKDADGNDLQRLLWVCYKDQAVFIDPSPTNRSYVHGSLQIPWHARWKHRGVSFCDVSTHGLALLDHACVWLQQDNTEQRLAPSSLHAVVSRAERITMQSWRG